MPMARTTTLDKIQQLARFSKKNNPKKEVVNFLKAYARNVEVTTSRSLKKEVYWVCN